MTGEQGKGSKWVTEEGEEGSEWVTGEQGEESEYLFLWSPPQMSCLPSGNYCLFRLINHNNRMKTYACIHHNNLIYIRYSCEQNINCF